ncbi:MAG: hypothetical protein KKD44_25050 [Proteobacteria bacterium]|nr:hypothetical protein [Pseudomonadota bacterium]
MYDLVTVLDGLTKEITNTISEMSKCKDIDQKKKLAEIIKMLCESMGIFFDSMGMVDPDLLDDFDDADDYSDDIVDFSSLKKGKKNKKKNDIPF